MELKPW